jgi:hypothetical protein
MPSVAIVYRDQLSPGENIVAPASKSQNLERLTKSTVTVWSDEVDCPDVVLNDVKGTYQRSQAAADQCRLDQIKSVHVTEENGFLTYRFLVFSQAASQAIVVPENAKAVIFAKNVPDAAMYSELQTGYTVFPGRRYSWQLVPGPTPSPPSPVAVRFALRNPTEAEAATPLVADWPPPVITLPADEQAQHDLLVSWLKRGATVSGTIRPDGATTDMPFNLQLTWNDKTGAAAGWIRQPKQRRGESIYGRIIDRPNGQSSILIVEENSEGNYGLGGGANSLWCSYDMHVQQTAKPSELVVRSAIFGNFQSKKTADVTQQLQKLVKDGVLTADISWHSLPDPAPRMAKTLQLEYSINGVVNNMTMNEGNTLVLGTPSVAAGSLTGRVWADRNAGYPLPPFTGTASLSTNVFQDK